MNMLDGRPKLLNVYSNTQESADFFNGRIIYWLKYWRRVCKAAQAWVPEAFANHLATLADITEVELQFFLCELSKIVKYLQEGSKTYERGYWERVAEAGAEWEEESGEEHDL